MKNKFFIIAAIVFSLQAKSQSTPHLITRNGYVQLIVKDKPFLVFGGELGNSSASGDEYMESIWPKLREMNLNAVFAPVYWELIEPEEGRFDFSSVDTLIKNARLNQIKLIILWFGAWKNSMSCYAPAWVKTNSARFPRALDKSGSPQEIITPFNNNNLQADIKAFARLMQYIKGKDVTENTVITVQVENEIGMLPDARTYDKAANAAFNDAVPAALINYLKQNQDKLLPETKLAWEKNGFKTSGNWEGIFGEGLATDEIFMAWHYATFTNELVKAGKDIYNLPMYVNAALNRPGWKPGAYPSAGPLPHILDIWKAGAPAIDIFSPDIYFPDFKHWADLYTRNGNPLFIPETGSGAAASAKAFFAFGNYNCIAYSPFSIESADDPVNNPMSKAYDVLGQVSHLVTQYQPDGNVKGFLLEKDSVIRDIPVGDYLLTVQHEYKMGWSPGARNDTWPQGGVLIITIAPDEFYVAGTGFVITFVPKDKNKKAGILSVDEGEFKNDKWLPGRRMNGDQDHQGRHVRIPYGQYGIQHVKLYMY